MKKLAIICFAVVFILGCNNSDEGMDGNGFGFGQDPPIGVLLVFPQQDSLCNEGENPTPTESTVFFEWEPNNNATSYVLTVENLSTGVVSQYQTEDFIFPVTIGRADPFRWFVEYAHQGETKQSSIWNFYNAGPGVQTYPPFPAEIIAPTMAQNIQATTSVTLEWTGSDLDDDIVGYDVYFGTANSPSITANDNSTNQLTVSVTSNTIYYWKVVTKDAVGNTSESSVYQFRVL